MDYDGALDLARRALAIDTYDPLANYAYGLAAAKLGRTADARDGFELAAQSVELRSAAWTELARLAIRGGDFERAASDAERSLDFNFRNLEGHQLLALARRLGGRADEAAASVDALLALDPLSTFGRFEKALAAGGDAPRAFAASLRGREAAGGPPRARGLVPRPRPGGGGRARARGRPEERRGPLLARVPEGGPGRRPAPPRPCGPPTPPRRPSSSPSARSRPRCSPGPPRRARAGSRATPWPSCTGARATRTRRAGSSRRAGETPDFAPFYAARALALESVSPEKALVDLERAARLDPAQWRFGRALADRQLRTGATAARARDGGHLRRALPGQLHPRHAPREGAARERPGPRGRGEARPPERPALRGRDRGPPPLPRGPPHARGRGPEEGRRQGGAARDGRGPPLAREPRRGPALPREPRRAPRGLPRRAGPGAARPERGGERSPPEGRRLHRAPEGARGGHPRARAGAEAVGPGGGGAQAPRRLDGSRSRKRARGLGRTGPTPATAGPLPEGAGEEARILAAWLATASR